ncbi:MAG: gliding motility-associated C-terminal domain-containing protein [Chitinophagales bacterium]|nr:gliding motility-associated C-terminal domain-containing protein [Chitinophagales bacterium]
MRNALALFFLFAHLHLFAQNAFWSNNGLVSVKDGAYLSVVGDAYNQNNGIYNNTDSIFVTGNWTHNAPNRCFDSIGTGWVFLWAADQHIKGNSETHFHHLTLKNQGVKYGDLDVYVDGTLNLTDRELSMDNNTVWCLNPSSVTAVERTSGYVSSLQDGGLLRRTNSTDAYLFPVGSNLGVFRYRPVEFQPKANNENHYKARFANVDPTMEGFDRNDRFHLVCEINPDWYHRLYHITGNDSADITIFYNTLDDGNQWNDIVHWQVVPEWQSIKRDTIVAGNPFNRISKFTWDNYVYSPFALALTTESYAVAGVDTMIWRTDTIQLNAFGGLHYEWTPDYNMDCNDCQTPQVWPDTTTTYYLTVADGRGCYDYDSVVVFVRNKPLTMFFIPNTITPNGDGYNDRWYIRDLERYPDNEVRIINRWGDEIFFQKPYENNWEGTWKGERLPGATYYYIIKIKYNGDVYDFNGPLTVVR